ncbi:shikimate dehydrogenase [Shewanella fidelis]|uniref:Shikimate dehydrogenase (NADP(+)) n=1 Tax=Shewanella fidelis TaxID=173509 RepID=A0AAW8NSM2_9GAMM|nr:shikimate dehydrogenase [Shewanella fidelis]MDR8525826.1 shikimate dehydrogenase [Shewanella fidelis]MDW4813917.1 shikimate dehydrogenase [Shewanella fidelis]MDW4818082.1 shikimate dehydrogenase [Shewanella fidelis]MDW4822080.1 shikimate dehydrogenase [Shewanella fidelis]MDW4826315.1 shikimate dehydrogenase [Shewanella fidelis]
MTERYAVFGNPISHSKSPKIHAMFAKETAQSITYEAILAPVDEFEASFKDFVVANGRGANVTVPFKEQAFALCDELSEQAKLAGAVNTLSVLANGKIRGDNTDGLGIVADLQRNLGSLQGLDVLLVGAGGAARGCILPLLNAGIAKLTIVNRTQVKAETLANLFAPFGNVDVLPIEHSGQSYDLIINSTSSSLTGDVPNISTNSITPQTVCYDMMYGKQPTAFNLWATAQGARQTIDGLGMLVGQAAESFNIWRKVKPNVEPVLTQLRAEL